MKMAVSPGRLLWSLAFAVLLLDVAAVRRNPSDVLSNADRPIRRPDAHQATKLLDGAPMLSGYDVAVPVETSRPLHICILTGDLYGMPEMGGTATAFWHLSNMLKDRMKPTPIIKWLGVETPIQSGNCSQLIPHYGADGLELICIKGSRSWSLNPFRQAGWSTLLWLRSQPSGTCDVLHGHEWGGMLRPIIEAKLLGEFRALHVNTVPHGGHMWSRIGDTVEKSIIDEEVHADERFVLENSNSIVSPTTYMIQYLQSLGWQLNQTTTSVIGNVQAQHLRYSPSLRYEDPQEDSKDVIQFQSFSQVVFFGRLEARKGLHLFLSAIAAMPQRNDPNFKVAFIGSDPTGARVKLLESFKALWECQTSLYIGLSREAAMAQLKDISEDGGALVVIPSLIDNQPFTIAEVAAMGLPMLSFKVGGVDEMLTVASAKETLIAADWLALHNKLEKLLNSSTAAVPILRPSLLYSWQTWLAWHLNVVSTPLWLHKDQIDGDQAVVPSSKEVLVPLHSTKHMAGNIAFQDPSKVDEHILVIDIVNATDPSASLKAICNEEKFSDVNIIAFTSKEFITTEGIDHMYSIMKRSMTGVAMNTGVKVFLDDGTDTQAAFPYGPSFLARVGHGDMCLTFVPSMFDKRAFCSQVEHKFELSTSTEGLILSTLEQLWKKDSSAVATSPYLDFKVKVTSSLIKPCNTALVPRPDTTRVKSRVLRRLAQASVGSPSSSVVVGGATPGREYSCNLVAYVRGQAPNRCSTTNGLIQYCCESPATCATLSNTPQCSDDVVQSPTSSPGGVVLGGTAAGREYDCLKVQYINGQSPTYCLTSSFQQYCCAFPTTCGTFSATPTCSGDSSTPLPSGSILTPGRKNGREYDCSAAKIVNGQYFNYCATSVGALYCCNSPATCGPSLTIPTCSDD